MVTEPAPLIDSPKAWRRLAITLAAATVGNVGMWSFIVVMPAVQAEFDVARGGATLPYTLTMLGFALGNLVMGRAVDRFGITLVLFGSSVLMAASYLAASFAPTILILAALQFLIGLGGAASFGPLIADLSLWFQRRRGIAVAIAASGNYLSGAIWPLILAGILRDQGWRAVYLLLAVVVVALVLPFAVLLRARVPDAERDASETRAREKVQASAFSPRKLQGLLALAGISCCVAMSMPQVHIVSFCVDLGYGPAVGAQMLSLMLFGGVGSRLLSGLLADRLGGARTLLIGSTMQCLALFLYLPFDGLVPLYIVSLIFGLSQGGIVPAYALIIREYLPAREAGARVGFVMMATILGMALGGWMSGYIYDLTGSYEAAFLNGIGWNLLNIAIISLVVWRGRGRASLVPA